MMITVPQISESGGEYGGRVRGSTIVVNASGGGDYTHIQWAVDNASEGDTIYVQSGTYYEHVVIDKTISLVGAGSGNTTIDGWGGWSAIRIMSNSVNITGFNITNSSKYSFNAGIEISTYENCKVEKCMVYNNNIGIYLEDANKNVIGNNSAKLNGYGIYLHDSNNNIIHNNTCNSNKYYGILVQSSNFNNINDNVCFSNLRGGISLSRSQNNIIRNSLLEKNGFSMRGSDFTHWDTNEIDTSNKVNNKSVFFLKNIRGGAIPRDLGQVIIFNCSDVLIENQVLSDCTAGIEVAYSRNLKISNNTCNSNIYGIYLYKSVLCSIAENSCENNEFGIYLHFSNNNNITNNCCLDNQYGIDLLGACNNSVKDNICNMNNNTGIFLSFSTDYNDGNFDVITVGNNSVSNNTCNQNEFGIQLAYSCNNIIEKNNCSINSDGIHLDGSPYNEISYNKCNSNRDVGISLIGGYFHLRSFDSYFTPVTSSYCSLFNNICSNNFIGIYLNGGSSYNSFIGNQIINSIEYGVEIENWNKSKYTHPYDIERKSSNNSIYYNNFFNNNRGSIQAFDNGTDNNWNNSGSGNHWSDWTEPDTNGDGIVDFAYNLSGPVKTKDYFPLTRSVYIFPPKANAGPDIAIDQHETVDLNGTLSWCVQNIINYTWFFIYDGMQIHLYGPSQTFIFHEAGIYVVTLQVSTDQGISDMDTMTVVVIDITTPVANAGENMTVCQNEIVFFDAKRSYDNVGIVNFSWTLLYQEEVHFYGEISDFKFDDAGLFEMVLNVSDAEGNWATDTVNVTVLDITPPTANAGPDIAINQSDTVIFPLNENSSDNVGCWNWTWTFQYNNTTQMLFYSMFMSSLPGFTFDIPGNYSITMTVNDSAGNWAVDILNITVLESFPPIEPEIDSDNDTYNDIFELEQGSDPSTLSPHH